MTHASVFSGIGGPEVAATMLGWENLFHCEINPFGRKVLDYWYPNSKSYNDITKTDFTEWRGRVDVFTGGFPCQPFSYAGQRRGAEDDRYLWPSMFRCIDEVQPTWVIAENVAGITTMVEQGEVVGVAAQAALFEEDNDIRRYELRETFTLERICNDLGQHGYDVQPILIPACSVGAPHRRDRVFIVARRIASDSDNRTDGRTAGEDEGKGREERIQERNEVRKPDEPNQVRPTSEGNAPTDSEHQRQVWSEHEGQPRPEEGIPSRSSSGDGRERTTSADTDHNGLQHDSIGREQADVSGAKSEGGQDRLSEQVQCAETVGTGKSFADTMHERLQRWLDITQEGHGQAPHGSSGFMCEDTGIAGLGRWADFPSVSPVHRGNDGLPFDVDRLTISFGKWRTESLKAYGNAIVPQVMYEIFRAIEIASHQSEI